MITHNYFLVVCLLLATSYLHSQNTKEYFAITIQWDKQNVLGSIDITNGNIYSVKIKEGQGNVNGNKFNITNDKSCKLEIQVKNPKLNYGPGATVIHMNLKDNSFSFFLRDVNEKEPIYIPSYKVIVLTGDDPKNYKDIEREVFSRKRLTKFDLINRDPEASFSRVQDKVRNMTVPIWLGMSRDMRIFEISEELEDTDRETKVIRPKYATSDIQLPDFKKGTAAYIYALGRGKGVENNITRYLESGSLPIYHSQLKDDDVIYHTTSFVSFDKMPLNETTNKGTNFVVSDKHSSGRTFKDEHLEQLKIEMEKAYEFSDNSLLYSRTEITNAGDVPRYAWIKTPRPGTGWWDHKVHSYDSESGFSFYSEDRIFCISILNGAPMLNEEMAILIMPGETVEYEFFMPHTPISYSEAQQIPHESFDSRFEEVKGYWNDKLKNGGKINVPENRIEDMIKAGLLHLDLITFGEEPNGTLATNIGVYSTIGTESAPIIQFYLSIGWFDVAKRAIDYFFDTQLESGIIQNYGGYMGETGAALWTMGEYFRYTRDEDWVLENKDKFLKSCNYLIDWRKRNQKPELKGKGYGMVDGKVADPEDPYHSFMLNGYGYIGVKRIAEVLRKIDPAEAERLNNEAENWKSDIRESFFNSMGHSPVVPLGDGTWIPTVSPWPEIIGPRALYQKKESFWSHGTFTDPDALLSPLYLVFCEVIAPEEKAAKIMLDYHSELFYQGNSAFSQPYYSRHNWLQAKLGMVKPFLNTYYHTMAAHADRETYTFWEHLYRVSPHKTHEEAWFLMETRWMLYMEEGDTLSLLKTIPRAWMEDGKVLVLDEVQSYFGPLSLKVTSHINDGYIEAQVKCNDVNRRPSTIQLRLPHPENMKPKKVIGGAYDYDSETITISNFTGDQNVRVEF